LAHQDFLAKILCVLLLSASESKRLNPSKPLPLNLTDSSEQGMQCNAGPFLSTVYYILLTPVFDFPE